MSQVSEDAVRIALASAREQLTAEITEAIEKAVREERAAVVAWLRSGGFVEEFHKKIKLGWFIPDIAADAIERGEHRREEDK